MKIALLEPYMKFSKLDFTLNISALISTLYETFINFSLEFIFSSSKRPERLISKLKAMNLEDDARAGRKIVVIRQPKGPDGTKGFSAKRAY